MSWKDFTFEGSGLKRRVKFDPSEGKVVFEASQPNIQDCIDLNVAWRNADRSTTSLWNGGEYVKVASIPLVLLEKWRNEEGIDFLRWNDDDKARVMQKLNDGNYGKLRTAPGSI